MFKYPLGQEVKDKISGLRGVVMCRTEYLTGCNRYSIQTKGVNKKTGNPYDWKAFDEDQLIDMGKNINHNVGNPGGPQPYEDLLRK